MFSEMIKMAHVKFLPNNEGIPGMTLTERTLNCLSIALGIAAFVVAILAITHQLSMPTSSKILIAATGYQLFYTGYISKKFWSFVDYGLKNPQVFVSSNIPPDLSKRGARMIAKLVVYFLLVNAPGLIGGIFATQNLISAPLLAALTIVPLGLHLLIQMSWRKFPQSCQLICEL